ncbi:EMILIN-1-like [Mercenaria mercenaria]|uniref:EMILIN-1-like n=1 Tax=Mercenaria mercenaria TaxID=6596 RepID=UPI00234E3AB4|nr:EMILIN-1-like [Mercenaria mercenaria]
MVRMEFFVENMQKDVQKSITNVMDVMNGIKEKNVEITDNLSGLREKIENVDLKVENVTDTMNGIKETNTKVADKFSKLHGEMKKLELKTENIVDKNDRNSNDIEEIKASETQAVAFNAYVAVEYSGKDTVVFSTVILNEGKAYDNNTGIFTAPIDGVYQFNAHLCLTPAVCANYYLKVGRRSIASGEYRVSKEATDTKCTSFGAVALVRKGEQVRVRGMLFEKLGQSTDDWNSFSGVLIQKV